MPVRREGQCPLGGQYQGALDANDLRIENVPGRGQALEAKLGPLPLPRRAQRYHLNIGSAGGASAQAKNECPEPPDAKHRRPAPAHRIAI